MEAYEIHLKCFSEPVGKAQEVEIVSTCCVFNYPHLLKKNILTVHIRMYAIYTLNFILSLTCLKYCGFINIR